MFVTIAHTRARALTHTEKMSMKTAKNTFRSHTYSDISTNNSLLTSQSGAKIKIGNSCLNCDPLYVADIQPRPLKIFPHCIRL